MKRVLFGLALACGFALVPACSSEDTGSSSGSSGTTPPAAAATVTVKSNEFSPATVTVKVGESVQWTWAGGSHNVVSGTNCAGDNNFTSGNPQTGGTFEKKFEAAGTFDYFCTPHCGMGDRKSVV